MPSTALAQLESLLTARKLDHTISSHRPSSWNEHSLAPTGFAALDELVAGGLPGGVPSAGPCSAAAALGCPRGQISEIVGPRSSGRQTVLVSCLAAATQRGELTALVDPLDMFDPSSAAARGVDLSRLLWVRGRALLGPDVVSLPREAGDLRTQIKRAVKALNLILQATGFGLVALDLGEVPIAVTGRLPFTTWRRLHRVIEGGDTACVVVASEPLARSVAGITLALDGSLTPDVERAAPRHVGLEARGGGAPRALKEEAKDAETFNFKNSASSACSAATALKNWPRHVRLLPPLKIEGRAVHARGMRTERVVLETKN